MHIPDSIPTGCGTQILKQQENLSVMLFLSIKIYFMAKREPLQAGFNMLTRTVILLI